MKTARDFGWSFMKLEGINDICQVIWLDEFARLANITRKEVDRMVMRGEIPAYRMFRRTFIRRKDVETYLSGGFPPIQEEQQVVVEQAEQPKADGKRRRRWKLRITHEHKAKLLEEQSGLCAICGQKMKNPRLDHDHSCCGTGNYCVKCARGFLCNSCNVGLGMFRDSVTALNSAIAYLTKGTK